MLENDLTNIEMLIMKCIWDTPEELALSQLVAMVNERFEKSWKPQTISTYLAHLVRRKGKVFLYHPEVSEESYRSSQIDELVNYWGDPGTPTEFLSALFVIGDSESESDEDLEDLRKLLDELD
jgi:predicted transcriptional regulator